jgi:hypothetical protein
VTSCVSEAVGRLLGRLQVEPPADVDRPGDAVGCVVIGRRVVDASLGSGGLVAQGSCRRLVVIALARDRLDGVAVITLDGT